MAPAMATARLRKELIKLQKEPPPGIIAEPDERNILKWHYAIRGPSDTSFDGGVYVGKLVFPNEYPMKAPAIYMLTPSGRFQINTMLCMSMSNFHNESWNPLWSVSSIIQGIQSFMASTELTTGGIKSPESEHKRLAKESMAYNKKTFVSLFGGDIEAALEIADKARLEAEAVAKAQQQQQQSVSGRSDRRKNRNKKNGCVDDESRNNGDGGKDGNDNTVAASAADDQPKQELTPEEIEKRRKRNAKKRAKQKAKKAAAAAETAASEEEAQQQQ